MKKKRVTPARNRVWDPRWPPSPRRWLTGYDAEQLLRAKCPRLALMLGGGVVPMTAFFDEESRSTYVRIFFGRCRLDLAAGGRYLGAFVTQRSNRKGEKWLRGHDLPDGPFTQKTFNAIVLQFLLWCAEAPTAADLRRLDQ